MNEREKLVFKALLLILEHLFDSNQAKFWPRERWDRCKRIMNEIEDLEK